MNRLSKLLIAASATSLLVTGAFASCGKDGKSCDYKNNKHHSMCSMKKTKEYGKNSPRMVMKAINRLDLTPDQRTKIDEIKNKYHATIPNISDAFTKNSLDEKKLNEALNFDIKTIQLKIISESYEVLNDIQRGFLKEILEKKESYKGGSYSKDAYHKNCNMRK